ncbi:MAG: NAD(P)(+) transhydrogenase (Re/Si-specific) subunit alpha [Acidobacteria bacterium]|nr:MAG: NAD(P)(+) transhydrogenase (Re/Si-specific) subunit alpha [Acidobacteriota bacterium]
MKIGVLREPAGETRAALVPESVRALVAPNVTVHIESGAADAAGATGADYVAAGAAIERDKTKLLELADVLLCVNRPSDDDLAQLHAGAVVIGFLRPLDEPDALVQLIERGLTAFAMELIPRSTRAQSMDALSSMATIVGYKSVLLAAERLPRMFPLLMTAAGTIAPAKVLVLGAGVAGLQAIATARRLGAVVEGYDVRAAAGEHVRSLGARFLEVDLGGIQTEDAGGYAVELTEEALSRGRDLIAKHARTADAIITSAQVPGRRAPLLVTEEAVAGMKPGSVIVDLAGSTGGNCAASTPGETVVRDGVVIMSPLNLAATVPVHASQLYSRNVTAFLKLLIDDKGELEIDLSDDIVGSTCVLNRGEVVNARIAAALETAAQ